MTAVQPLLFPAEIPKPGDVPKIVPFNVPGFTVAFTVPGVPVAQPRQRHRILESKHGGKFVQNYTPTAAPVNAFKAAVRLSLSAVYKGPPLTGPLRMSVTFLFARPGRLIWKTRPMPRCWHWGKPDRDNLEKSLKDSLKGLLWNDDSQVCAGPIYKMYAAGDEQPCVEVQVTQLED